MESILIAMESNLLMHLTLALHLSTLPWKVLWHPIFSMHFLYVLERLEKLGHLSMVRIDLAMERFIYPWKVCLLAMESLLPKPTADPKSKLKVALQFRRSKFQTTFSTGFSVQCGLSVVT